MHGLGNRDGLGQGPLIGLIKSRDFNAISKPALYITTV